MPSYSGYGQPIIAGDGYAYFPYSWGNSATWGDMCVDGNTAAWGHYDAHLGILRVGTDGSALEIRLGDWAYDFLNYEICSPQCQSVESSAGGIPRIDGVLITNSDQGVVYSWVQSFQDPVTSAWVPQFELTTIAQDGTATTVPTSMWMQPVLQRADGSYVGTASTSEYVQGPMTAFTASGQQLWSQPNYTPQIATAGGGVIAASTSGSGQTVTFDANGNQTGQLANVPTQSWIGGSYLLSSGGGLQSLSLAGFDYASSFTAMLGGNNSSNNNAQPQAQFAQLESCTDTELKPPPQCPGPRELIWNAEKDLVNKLNTDKNCSDAAQKWIFSKLTERPGLTTADFLGYLGKSLPQFYDGTSAQASFISTCQANSGPAWGVCAAGRIGEVGLFGSVADYFKKHDGSDRNDPVIVEATTIGGNNPLIVFFRPSVIKPSSGGKNEENEAMLFHEALHGYTNLSDNKLEDDFTGSHGKPSEVINEYIIEHVLNVCGGQI